MHFVLQMAEVEAITVIWGGGGRTFVSLTRFYIANIIFLQTLWYFLQAVKEVSYTYLYTFMYLLLFSM